MTPLSYGSLFAGIGGFDLGFERAGMRGVWQVEIDKDCRKLLANRFPDAVQYDDVRSVGKHNLTSVDGGVRRMRRINIWRKFLQPNMFSDLYQEPEVGKIDATLWAKHRKTGIVNQFIRGKRLRDYRALLIAEGDKTP